MKSAKIYSWQEMRMTREFKADQIAAQWAAALFANGIAGAVVYNREGADVADRVEILPAGVNPNRYDHLELRAETTLEEFKALFVDAAEMEYTDEEYKDFAEQDVRRSILDESPADWRLFGKQKP